MNTKARKKLNDTVLAIRLPAVIRDQLEVVAHAQYKNSSELVRELIINKMREATQYLPSQPPTPTLSKPSQQVVNDEWDY